MLSTTSTIDALMQERKLLRAALTDTASFLRDLAENIGDDGLNDEIHLHIGDYIDPAFAASDRQCAACDAMESEWLTDGCEECSDQAVRPDLDATVEIERGSRPDLDAAVWAGGEG